MRAGRVIRATTFFLRVRSDGEKKENFLFFLSIVLVSLGLGEGGKKKSDKSLPLRTSLSSVSLRSPQNM